MRKRTEIARAIAGRYPSGKIPYGDVKQLCYEFHTTYITMGLAVKEAGLVTQLRAEHGRSAYSNRKCRCEICRDAARVYSQERRDRRKAAQP